MKIFLQLLFSCLFISFFLNLAAQEELPVCKHYLSEINSLRAQGHTLDKKQNDAFSYDVKYYRMNWYIDPAIDSIKGSVLMGYKVTSSNFNTIALDMDTALHVDSIFYHGSRVFNYSFPGFGPINITLNPVPPAGTFDTIQIFYHGRPNPTHRGFVQDYHNNVPIIWTLSEPYFASDWWPCKQDLVDKADSIDVYITVPQYCKAACNGKLIYVAPKDTFSVYYWHHAYPITPYLVGIAVTNFHEFSEWMKISQKDSMPVLTYVWPEDEKQWRSDAQYTVPALLNYGRLFELYPFSREKYGNAEFNFGGGQEHQTMSFVRNMSFYLQVHEMAHQWFGDKVTCHSWQDIWLNEGFASYCECLSYQSLMGQSAFMASKNDKIKIALQAVGQSVAVDDTTSVGRIFSYTTTYCKGAIVLHMLRYMLGDSVFFHSCRNYLKDPSLAYSFAQTSDLQRHFEKESGTNLQKFFNDWIFRKGYPQYTIKWKQATDGKLLVDVSQIPTDPSVEYYSMPVPVSFWSHGKDTVLRLMVDSITKEFTFHLPYFIDSIQADPLKDLLATYKVKNLDSAHIGTVFISPNPTTDFITLEIMDVSLRNTGEYALTDMSGKVLYSDKYENAQAIRLDLTRLPRGMYILSYHSGSKKFSQKIVKE